MHPNRWLAGTLSLAVLACADAAGPEGGEGHNGGLLPLASAERGLLSSAEQRRASERDAAEDLARIIAISMGDGAVRAAFHSLLAITSATK